MKTLIIFFTLLLFFNLYACKKEVTNYKQSNKEKLLPILKKTKIKFKKESLICNGNQFNATECKNESIIINANISDIYFKINSKTYQYTSQLNIGLGHEFTLFSNNDEKIIVIDYFTENGHLYELFYADNLSLKFLGKKEFVIGEEDNGTQSFEIERINSEIILLNKNSDIAKFSINNSVKLNKKKNENNLEVIQEKNTDINQDGIQDQIQILWDKRSKNYSVFIYASDKNSANKKIFKNNKLLNISDTNSTGTGISGIVTKNNYITFENNLSEGNPTRNTYITFVYNTNKQQIYLHKYGITAMFDDDNSSKDWEKIYSVNDFGEVKFEDVTYNFLLKISN